MQSVTVEVKIAQHCAKRCSDGLRMNSLGPQADALKQTCHHALYANGPLRTGL